MKLDARFRNLMKMCPMMSSSNSSGQALRLGDNNSHRNAPKVKMSLSLSTCQPISKNLRLNLFNTGASKRARVILLTILPNFPSLRHCSLPNLDRLIRNRATNKNMRSKKWPVN